ncbi:hypothetical protein RTP6_003141 [Batrachochytrium dendrobatidis]
MENIPFYIQYLDNQPVGLRTHILNTNTFVWVQTLFTVANLVAAFQALPNSPLASAFVGDITLHYVMDGVETSYNSWDPIASTNQITNIIKGKRPQSSPFIIDEFSNQLADCQGIECRMVCFPLEFVKE